MTENQTDYDDGLIRTDIPRFRTGRIVGNSEGLGVLINSTPDYDLDVNDLLNPDPTDYDDLTDDPDLWDGDGDDSEVDHDMQTEDSVAEYQRLADVTASALNDVIAKQRDAIARQDDHIASLNAKLAFLSQALIDELAAHRQTLQSLTSLLTAQNLELQRRLELLNQ